MPTSLAQSSDQPLVFKNGKYLGFRYAYYRSTDSRENDDPGQDYLAFHEDGESLSFIICDGVSQAFMGNLGSQILGDILLDWLQKTTFPQTTENAIQTDLETYLLHSSESAKIFTSNYQLPDKIPPMVRSVLEQKRALGTESTFVAARIDVKTNLLILAWLGDSRLRVWETTGEVTSIFGDTFLTSERWSSVLGPVGQPHVQILPLKNIRRVVAYSDGLHALDGQPIPELDDIEIQSSIDLAGRLPESDDISFLDVWIGQREPIPELLAAPEEIRSRFHEDHLVLNWNSVPGAANFEVQLLGSMRIFPVKSSTFELNPKDLPAATIAWRVRARSGSQRGRWSEALDLKAPPITTSIPQSISLPPKPATIPAVPPQKRRWQPWMKFAVYGIAGGIILILGLWGLDRWINKGGNNGNPEATSTSDTETICTPFCITKLGTPTLPPSTLEGSILTSPTYTPTDTGYPTETPLPSVTPTGTLEGTNTIETPTDTVTPEGSKTPTPTTTSTNLTHSESGES